MLYNTAIALALAGFAAAAPQGVVYVTDVVKATTTYCPAGQTITHASGTTVLTAPTVITSSWVEKSSMSHPAPVSSATSVGAVGSSSPSVPASSPAVVASSSVPAYGVASSVPAYGASSASVSVPVVASSVPVVASSVPMVSSSTEVSAGTATPMIPGSSAPYYPTGPANGANGGSPAPTGYAQPSGAAGSTGSKSSASPMPSGYTGAGSRNAAGLTGLVAVAGAFLALA